MSKIKSALELAMEKTADIKVDEEALRRDEGIRKGRNIAGRYLSDPNGVSVAEELKQIAENDIAFATEGILETLLANLTLPRYAVDVDRLPVLTEGIKAVTAKHANLKTLDYLMKQYADLFKQYLDNLVQLEDQLRAQWEPRLKQKEQQLRQQTGQAVRLTPDQDPEFGKVLSEQLSRLDAQYGEILAQGKDEIRKLV